MLSPSRGPERLIRIGQWLIALLFAYFLIQVGSSLIADLPLLAKAPQQEQFVDRSRLEPLLAELKPLNQARDDLQGSLEGVRQKEVEAREAYATDKASFDNWRSARSRHRTTAGRKKYEKQMIHHTVKSHFRPRSTTKVR